MKVQDQVIATSITVLESNDMPFLFGLDMLRRHACQVHLPACLGASTHIAFQSAAKLPRDWSISFEPKHFKTDETGF